MKPSTRLSLTSGAPQQTSAARARQASTLYLATSGRSGLLLVAAFMLSATLASAGGQSAVASKSDGGPALRPPTKAAPQVGGDRQSSSPAASALFTSSSSSKKSNSDNDDDEDHHLAVASSMSTSAQLVPVRQFESVSSSNSRSAARSADLSISQSNIANAKVHASPRDMTAAAGHHYGGHSHGKYYMYAESPKKGAFKAGFKRGNHKHMIMRKEAQHKSHNHGYFKWHDKKGKGSHKWEFKHYDKKGKHHHHY